jgi:hypothetical protein
MNRELSASSCRLIFKEARKYLLRFPQVSNTLIDKYLDEWKCNIPNSIEDLLEGVLLSVRNRQGMPNTITDNDVENLKAYLFGYNPRKIQCEFQNNWKQVFKIIESQYHPKGNLDINNERCYWAIFCKAVVSASNFLARFANMNEFNQFVEAFYLNEYTRVALPLLLEREVRGMGFALACDFLKDNGFPKFVKPDVHIKAIFNGLEISDSDDDYQVFKDVIRFSEKIGEIPFRVDKIFWLVGSGRFYDDDIKIQTNRDEFILEVKKLLDR